MATNANWWRSSRTTFGALGTKTFFVDWDFGHNDAQGDGTPEHPFHTAEHGYNLIKATKGTTPAGCIVRGHGNEAFVGDHAFIIQGDYWGAAIYDGGGIAQIIYCTMKNIIYTNGGGNIDVDYSVLPYGNSIHAAFAGCGRAHGAHFATYADLVYGAAASPILIGNSKMYRGCIGGTQSTAYNIYAKIVCTPFASNQVTCGVTFGGCGLSATAQIGNCTVYDLPLSVRALTKSAQTNALHAFRWIFGKVDFIFEHKDFFYQCLFTSDCRMFYTDVKQGELYTNKLLKIVAVHGSNETPTFSFDQTDTDMQFDGEHTFGSMTVTGASIENFYDALVALYNAGHITINPATYFLNECKFTSESSADVFNSPDNYDLSTKPNSSAFISKYHYYGALPPSLNIPILGSGNSGSDSVAGCWDNRSIDGCLKVENGVIKIDTTSPADSGRIFSKVVKINPYEVQYNGIFASLTRRVKNGWIASKLNPFGAKLTPDENLQITLQSNTQYMLKGSKASFNGEIFYVNDVIDTTDIQNPVVTLETADGYLYTIIDANIPDTLYCRCRSMVYARAGLGELLKPQITYFNDGNRNIRYHNRTVVPNESFICDNEEEFYVLDDNGNADNSVEGYSIAVIFDDREIIPEGEERIGGATKWIPAQMFGVYFAMKNAGAITELEIPQLGSVPKASGNYMCYTKNGGGGQIDGYVSVLNQTFIQFAVFVKVISEFDVEDDLD